MILQYMDSPPVAGRAGEQTKGIAGITELGLPFATASVGDDIRDGEGDDALWKSCWWSCILVTLVYVPENADLQRHQIIVKCGPLETLVV